MRRIAGSSEASAASEPHPATATGSSPTLAASHLERGDTAAWRDCGVVPSAVDYDQIINAPVGYHSGVFLEGRCVNPALEVWALAWPALGLWRLRAGGH